MSNFDISAYYAERDELMNSPDETVDEFLKRISSLQRDPGSTPYASTSRMPQANNLIKDKPQPRSVDTEAIASSLTADAAPTCVAVERSEIAPNKSTTDFGRTLKRKAVDQELEVEHHRKKIIDRSHNKEIVANPSPIVPSISPIRPDNFDKEAPSSNLERSAELEEIDSFTVEPAASQIPNKRKTPPKHVRRSPRKERITGGNLTPRASLAAVTTEHSPILSFSRFDEDLRQKRASLRKEDVPSVPPLDLRPLHQSIVAFPAPKKKTKHDSDGINSANYDSPIEDASMSVSAASPAVPKKKRLEAEPSEMLLEMKERIAKHSTSKKQRDKVLKMKFKPVLQDTTISIAETAHHNDDSSIIYVSSSPSSRASSLGPKEVSASKKQGVKEKPAKPAVEKRLPKGKKEKPQPMTPAEYARSLQSKPVDPSTSGPPVVKRKSTGSKVLADKNIFYVGGDMRHASETTRKRMDIIVRHGGNLMPEYDPEVTTHIIAEAYSGPTLRALNLRSLKQIPDHIPTVKWTWVLTAMDVQSFSQDEIDRKLGDYSRYAAFAERINAGCELPVVKSVPTLRSKGKERSVGERPGEGRTSRDIESAVQPDPLISSEDSGEPGPSSSARPVGAPLSPPTSPMRPTGRPKAREPESPRAPSAQDNKKDPGDVNDPLAEFYQHAKLQRQNDDGWSSFGEQEPNGSDLEEGTDDDEGIPDSVRQMPKQKRGWTCDNKEPQRKGDCPNQDIIDKLSELMKLHKAKIGDDDHWRAFSYSKSIRALRNYPRRIKSYEEARGIRGVGEKTAQKIEEILETGELQRIKYETTKDVEVTRLFQGIYGVGQNIAFQWYSAGCRTLEDLRSGKGGVKLNHVQQIGLRYYDDINDRMPRAEAKAIFDLIKPIALSIDPRLFVEIMGSYRRGKADCGDIDILITRPIDDGKTHKGVMSRLLQKLHAAHILTEDLALPEDPYDLESTYRGLCRLPEVQGSRQRRIDILSIPWTSRGAALLYYTGDDIFNRAIRMKANVLGYSLNQRGLFGSIVRDPRDRRIKLNAGVLVASETEEEIFKILGVPWQKPHERVRG